MSMLRSVVHDLKDVLMPYLLPILLNFSDMPGAYGTVSLFLWVSLALCDYKFLLCLLCCNVDFSELSLHLQTLPVEICL